MKIYKVDYAENLSVVVHAENLGDALMESKEPMKKWWEKTLESAKQDTSEEGKQYYETLKTSTSPGPDNAIAVQLITVTDN